MRPSWIRQDGTVTNGDALARRRSGPNGSEDPLLEPAALGDELRERVRVNARIRELLLASGCVVCGERPSAAAFEDR
jgi:hypothetical protein